MLPEAGGRYNRHHSVRERDTLMRYIMFAGLILCALCSPSVHAASAPKPSCKKIRDAVWAGRTLEQVTAEFDTDAQTVMKCTQKQGKRKSGPKAKKQKNTTSKAAKGTNSSPKTSKSSGPSPKRKASAPRSGPLPAHLP